MREPDAERTVERGVVDLARNRSRMLIDLGPAGEDIPEHVVDGRVVGEEITIGDVVYQGRGLVEPSSGKPWVKLDYKRAFGGGGLGGGNETDAGDPEKELGVLRAVSSGFRVVGKEEVRGVETTHYRGSMNVGAVEGTWDLWVGEGLIRKLRFTDPERTFVTTTEFFDFGVQERIEAPPAALVADKTETLRPAPEKCRSRGEPITIAEAEDVLRKHGFSVHRDPGTADCGSKHEDEHRLTDLTNVLFEGPHENIDAHDEVTEREGHLICTVRPRPIYGGGWRIIDQTKRGEEASLVVANVECGLYPEDVTARAPHEHRLRAAFRDLQRLASP